MCLRCAGRCSLAERKKVFAHAVDAALEFEKSKVLIDGSEVTGNLSTPERYEAAVFLAQEIRQRALGKIGKMALCGQEPLVEPERFGETVAVNRGVDGRVMTDLDRARAWLLR